MGKRYVLGGYDASRASAANVQVYNPTTDTWTSAHPLPYPINHNAAAVAGGASWPRSLIGRWKAQVNAEVPRLALFYLCHSASRYALDH